MWLCFVRLLLAALGILSTVGGMPAFAMQTAQAPTAFLHGQDLLRQGRYTEAIASLQEAIRLEPVFDAAYHNLGIAYSETGHYQEAITAFREAIRLDPAYAPSHFGLGFTYWRQGNDLEAIQAYQETLRLDTTHAAAQYNLGLAYRRVGQTQEALTAMRRYLTMARDQTEQRHWMTQAEEIVRTLETTSSEAAHQRHTLQSARFAYFPSGS